MLLVPAGGSILASLGSFQQMWLSKKEFEEHGAGHHPPQGALKCLAAPAVQPCCHLLFWICTSGGGHHCKYDRLSRKAWARGVQTEGWQWQIPSERSQQTSKSIVS